MTTEGQNQDDRAKLCPVCNTAILIDHPQFVDQLKCFCCGYAEYKTEKPTAFAYRKPKVH